MPGKLVHTNEILVLLGDDWFVEKSAKQACEVIDRRMKCKLISNCFFHDNHTKF
jgi:prefoldin subunit 5